MEYTLKQLYEFAGPLSKFAGRDMSIQAAYRVQNIWMQVQSEVAKIETFRSDLAKRVCEEAGVPDAAQVPPEKMEEFSKEIQEFLENETVTIKVRSIGAKSIEGKISPMVLGPLIEAGIVVVPEEWEDGSDRPETGDSGAGGRDHPDTESPGGEDR